MTAFDHFSCPIPINEYPQVLLAHGGGGKLMNMLIHQMFRASFPHVADHDGAVMPMTGKIAMTTDSYVVRPLFFAGGDIGSLAVHGTVNDLAMCGAIPKYLSVAMILEEGLPMETLWAVVQSIAKTAHDCGVSIITGDTKVVDRGKGDGIFINTTGIGIIPHDLTIAPTSVQMDDVVILSGDIGRHGVAIMAQREGIEFETTITSDSCPLHIPVMALVEAGVRVRCLRDLTRGGLTSGVCEIAKSGNIHIHLNESAIPVADEVRGACEILGLDPLYIANEGRFIAFVHRDDVSLALDVLHRHEATAGACVIGRVTDGRAGMATITSPIGAERILEMFSGEQLPRIC
ncbi:MAG: hydrogenase expression/formation protein HypE [Phototrophicales bacterium]|nr:MAG: hydrogenase expression/formation protein HypE [Phototrophicales bacterium]